MPKTETNISNLKINRGTYEAIQANLSSIGENELIITTDKVLPIPTSSDSGKVVGIDSNGEYVLTTSSGGSTYTAGNGIDIANDIISVDTSVVALQSDLPSGDVNINFNDTTTTPTSTVNLENIFVGTTKYNVAVNPMTTAGDIIIGGASGTPTRLAKGTAGQVLTMNSGATAPEWQTPSGGGGSTPITTEGDLIIGDSNGLPTRLAVGSSNQILTSYSGSPYWRDLVADETEQTYVTLTSTDWTNLKSNHYLTKSFTGPFRDIDYFPISEESRYKLSINSINYEVRLSLNSSTEAKGLFIVKESSSVYEIAMFASHSGSNSVTIYFRCAQIA